MERRDALRTMAASALLALVPGEARAAWSRVARGPRPTEGLSDTHLALVRAIADTILPRTDTPGASDVRVHRFVDVIVSENYDDTERAAFMAGLDRIDATVMADRGKVFQDLEPAARGAILEAIEGAPDRRGEPARTYWRLKSLIVHGYFTSEPVMREVLHHQVMPGRFDGDAPTPLARAQRG